MITAAVERESYALAIVAMITSAIAAFVYLRIVVAMYLADPDPDDDLEPVRVPAGAAVAIGSAFAFTIAAGVLPSLVLDPADDAVPVVVATATADG